MLGADGIAPKSTAASLAISLNIVLRGPFLLQQHGADVTAQAAGGQHTALDLVGSKAVASSLLEFLQDDPGATRTLHQAAKVCLVAEHQIVYAGVTSRQRHAISAHTHLRCFGAGAHRVWLCMRMCAWPPRQHVISMGEGIVTPLFCADTRSTPSSSYMVLTWRCARLD